MADYITQHIDTACRAAEAFTTLFFEAIDLKRHTLNRFYMDHATLSWDGNVHRGKDEIQKFLESLPVSAHTLLGLDGQPVSIEAVKGQQTLLVSSTGHVKFRKEDMALGFAQSFVLAAQEGKWKIFSHTCRLQRPIPKDSSE